MINEQELRDIYYDPSKGYQSAEKLYQKAKTDGVKVSRRLVKEWLETQDTYTRFKPVIRKHKFMKTFVKGLSDQIQMVSSIWDNTQVKTNVLDNLTKNYNNTKHSSIHMKPKDVDKTNENMVWVTLYGHVLEGLQPPKFMVGDTVRVSKYKSIFAKGYEANFTEEIFKLSKVLRGDPTVYEIEDHEGEPIIGKFYKQELSLINKKDDRYKIEKIIRKKKGMALVKWLGYDSQSWIPAKDIKDIQ